MTSFVGTAVHAQARGRGDVDEEAPGCRHAQCVVGGIGRRRTALAALSSM